MRKLFKCLFLAAILAGAFYLGTVASDSRTLSQDLVRLHIVANSDSDADQSAKLAVRDALTAYLAPIMEAMPDAETAKEYLRTHLAELKEICDKALAEAQCAEEASVSLGREGFPIRKYDTFSLPSGIYDALRVKIGAAQGKNWWCVVFPSLCVPAASAPLAAEAGAGFSEGLNAALTGNAELRFFLLDCLGRLKIRLFS